MKKFILFILILFYQSNSNTNANECNINTYEGLANCSIEYIKTNCPIDFVYNNKKIDEEIFNLTDRFGRTNLRLTTFEDQNCNGRYKKIGNRTPRIFMYTENNSSELSWIKVYLGKYEPERFKMVKKSFDEKYDRGANFPTDGSSNFGLKLLRAGKISHLIYFYDDLTKGLHFYRDASGIPSDSDRNFDFSVLFFNTSSIEEINANIDFFSDLNQKIISQSGSGNQL